MHILKTDDNFLYPLSFSTPYQCF